jgi:hypothetical protein
VSQTFQKTPRVPTTKTKEILKMSQSNQNTANIVKERKPTKTEVDFMKLIEEQNVKRVLKLKKTRKNNILVGKLQNFLEIFITLNSGMIFHENFSSFIHFQVAL